MKNCRILAVDTFSTSALVADGLIYDCHPYFLSPRWKDTTAPPLPVT